MIWSKIDLIEKNIVLEGTWIYDQVKVCNLRIIKENIKYGSGDYEDSLEIRNDQEIECYYVEYESMVDEGKICSRSGAYFTIEEAIIGEEKFLNQKIKLKDDWI